MVTTVAAKMPVLSVVFSQMWASVCRSRLSTYRRPQFRPMLDRPLSYETLPSATPYFIRPEECTSKYGNITTCDRCDQQMKNHFSYCSIFAAGNYDICQSCSAIGQHYFNSEHYLREHIHKSEKGPPRLLRRQFVEADLSMLL